MLEATWKLCHGWTLNALIRILNALGVGPLRILENELPARLLNHPKICAA